MQCFCNILFHLLDMWAHLRSLRNDRRINILNYIHTIIQQLSYMLQKLNTGNSFVCRICIRKMLSDISK